MPPPVGPARPGPAQSAELCCQRGDLFRHSRKGGNCRKKGGVRGQIEEERVGVLSSTEKKVRGRGEGSVTHCDLSQWRRR